MLKEKIEELIFVLQIQSEMSERQMAYVHGLIESAVEYVRAVVIMESRMQILRYRLEPDEYRITVEQLDRSRRSAHDAFIGKLSIVNRICAQMNLPPIYTGPAEGADLGEFAFTLVEEYKIKVRTS